MRSVLLVEDEPDTLATLTALLESEGWHVTGAPSGEQALPLLAAQAFDAVVADYGLPGMTGKAFLARVARAQPAAERFLFTASQEVSGAFLVVRKPTASTLLAALDRAGTVEPA